jgi:hypothetical protein
MHANIRLFILSALIIIAVYAAGFLAGHLRANGRNSLEYGIELESIRNEELLKVVQESYSQTAILAASLTTALLVK